VRDPITLVGNVVEKSKGSGFCRCFLHRQEQSDQDHAFQFGLANYKAQYDLSWFRLILKGNSPTSSGLILNMNKGYNGVSRELEKFTW
jgi:hypothetical protein